MKKVILTGATGLIGKEAIEPLRALGFEVYSKRFDLFDHNEVERVFKNERADYLLHFAWVASGDYLASDLNYKLKDSSLNMLKVFEKYGGKRAVFAGTCFEYEFCNEPLKENGKLNPITLYAKCKNELRQCAEEFAAKQDLSFGWGRIFYVFGHNEYEKRLTPHVINSLRSNQRVTIDSGPLIRDYMYTKDIAAAFSKFLDTNVTGCVNICTGEGISIRDYVLKVALMLEKPDLVEFKDAAEDVIKKQPQRIVGDNARLKNEVGYKIEHSVDCALEAILNETL